MRIVHSLWFMVHGKNKGFTRTRINFKEICNGRGFTLFETVVVAGIAVIVGALLVGILVNNTGVTNTEKSNVTQGLSANDSLAEIDNYIRQAASIVSGYPTVTPTYISGNNIIVIKIPATDSQGTISNVFDYVVITKDSTNANLLKEYIFPDSLSTRNAVNKVLSTILESITFTYLDSNENIVTPTSAVKVKTEINVLSQNGQANKSRSATIVTSLRNL